MNSPSKPLYGVIIASSVLFILRLMYVHFGAIDLAPDEAHYWEWSRYLDWSYYSKPPMVAWLNSLSTSMFGYTHIGVRFFSVLILSILTVLAYLIAYRATGKTCAGIMAAVLLNVTPEFAAGGLMMTPDVPTLLFWSLAVYLLLGVDFHEKPEKASLKTFALLGIVIGFAGLSKYTAALFYPLLGLYLVIHPERRQWLLAPHIYMAGVISLMMQAPVFYWNAVSDWITFKHVAGQSSGSSSFNGVKSIGNFVGGQIGVVGLVVFPFMLWVWLRMPKYRYSQSSVQKRMMLLWWFSAPLFLFFLMKSLGSKVQPNWPVLSIWGGLMLLACWIVFESRVRKKILYAGMAFSLMVTIVAHDTHIVRQLGVDLPFKKDPLKPALGWRGLGDSLSQMADKIAGEKVILTTRYQTASELSFYMKDNPYVIYYNPGHRRQNQYDLWAWPDLEDKIVLYVREGSKSVPEAVLDAFDSCIYVGAAASHRDGFVMRHAHMHACAGYKGLERQRPEKY